jgi:hypothetical protein
LAQIFCIAQNTSLKADKGESMTNTSNKAPQSKTDPIATAVENMIALNPMQGGVLKAMYTMGTETMAFLSSRMQHDIETQKALLTCKTLEDLQSVQARFYKKALEDYSTAASKMMGIISASSGDVGSPLPSTKRAYDDVPL